MRINNEFKFHKIKINNTDVFLVLDEEDSRMRLEIPQNEVALSSPWFTLRDILFALSNLFSNADLGELEVYLSTKKRII